MGRTNGGEIGTRRGANKVESQIEVTHGPVGPEVKAQLLSLPS